MATDPIGGSPSPVTFPNLLSTFDRGTLASAVEVLVAVIDAMDAPLNPDEPDFSGLTDELPGDLADAEPSGDDKGDQAWIEWHTMRGSQKRGHNLNAGHEDDEDCDPAEDDDAAGQCDEDEVNTAYDMIRYTPGAGGPGCELSDPGGCEHDGREVTGAEDDFMHHAFGGPGCPVSDPGEPEDGF